MNREILKSMDTGHIPVQRLTALLETFTLKHAARMLPDLLETADLQDSSLKRVKSLPTPILLYGAFLRVLYGKPVAALCVLSIPQNA